MTEKTNPNDAAFACASTDGYQQGLTKRELFATAALKGLLAQNKMTQNDCVIYSVRIADAFIAELNKQKP